MPTSTLTALSRAKTAAANAHPKETRERILVTPELAQAWLDMNVTNRKVIANHVETLARDMRAGQWSYTGEAIKFDWNKNLMDGQHRLLACIKAEQPFETLVIYNLPPEVQKKMDGGRSRKAADIMSMGGLHHPTVLAGACRLLLSEKHGATINKLRFTTTELVECLDRHKSLPASVNFVRSTNTPRGVPPTQVATIHYIGARLLNLEDVAERFVEVIKSGVPSYEGDPAHFYRERMITGTGQKIRDPQGNSWRLIKRAWNLFAQGTPTKGLRSDKNVEIEGLIAMDL